MFSGKSRFDEFMDSVEVLDALCEDNSFQLAVVVACRAKSFLERLPGRNNFRLTQDIGEVFRSFLQRLQRRVKFLNSVG